MPPTPVPVTTPFQFTQELVAWYSEVFDGFHHDYVLDPCKVVNNCLEFTIWTSADKWEIIPLSPELAARIETIFNTYIGFEDPAELIDGVSLFLIIDRLLAWDATGEFEFLDPHTDLEAKYNKSPLV